MKESAQHILIVDDNATLRKLLAEILQAKGYTTSEASDGVEGLELLEKTRVDAIISDILMPNMDGYMFCYEVRRSRKHSTLPFIFLTAAYTSPGDEQHALDLGADRILKKPLSSTEILNALREMFSNPLYQKPRAIIPIREVEVIKQYTDGLVTKLEEKIIELHERTKELKTLSSALEQTGDSVVITNKEGVIEYVNPAFETITGYKKEFAIGKTPAILKSGKQDAAFYEKLWKTILSGKVFREEFVNRKSNGEFFYEQQTISPVLDNDGKVVHFVSAGRDVTERKRAEEQLRSAHAQMKQLLDHSPAVIFRLKIEHERVLPYVMSENITRLLGFTVEESKSFEWWAAHLHPDDKNRAFASIEETLQRGTLTCEYRLRHKNGEYVWVEDTRRVLRDSAGRSDEIIGVWTDITERRRAEEQLKLLAHTITSARDCISIADLEDNLIFVNRSFCELYGYSQEEILGKKVSVLRAASVKPEQAEQISRATLAGSWYGEVMNQRKDGSEFPIELWTSAVENDSGQAVATVGVSRDITERKLAVEDLVQSEKKYRTLFEESKDGLFISTVDGKIIDVNLALVKTLGYDSKEEMLTLDIAKDIYVNEMDREKLLQRIELDGYVQDFETVEKKKDGQKINVLLNVTAVRDKEGNISMIRGLTRDVTKQRQLEAQFLRAQRMESIGTLAGGIAHDLNNVLAPIVMGIEMLKSKVIDEGSQKILRTLETSAQRGSGMVKQVLAFARGISGEHVILQVGHLIREMEKIVRETFPKSIQFKTEVPRGLWSVSADATQLHQVLLNLCVNARDAMPDGGILTITAENTVTDKNFALMNVEAKAGPYVVLTVTDTGTGIPQDLLDKVFEPFFTTKEIGKGTGLGLSTVYSIVKSHAGFINVYSEVGRGTEFRVYLPAEPTAEEKKSEGEQVELPVGHGELILVVDDEASIRDICRTLLETYGYNVLTATDGTEAVVQYMQRMNDIQLVITDMMMPFMDGRAMIQALYKINPEVKIIAASGFMPEEKSIVQSDLSICAFLAKPYTAAKLLAAVAGAFAGEEKLGKRE